MAGPLFGKSRPRRNGAGVDALANKGRGVEVATLLPTRWPDAAAC